MRTTSSLIALATFLAATPAFAAGGHGEGFPWGHWVASMINLIIFVGLIAKYAGPGLRGMFDDRREKLMADLNEAKRLREAAEAKLNEYSQRLDALDPERKQLMDDYHAQGEAEKKRLVDDAKRQVEKMRSDAELVIQQELRKAVRAIEEQAVDMALNLAETRVKEKLDGKAQHALVDGFVNDLKSLKSVA